MTTPPRGGATGRQRSGPDYDTGKAPQPQPLVEIIDVRPIDNSNIKAFLTIRVGIFTLHGCKIVQQSGQQPWLALPDREFTTGDGSRKWQRIVEITDKGERHRLSDEVVTLWEAQR